MFPPARLCLVCLAALGSANLSTEADKVSALPSSSIENPASNIQSMFDPTIPADHADLTGVMFRSQFNGLKDLIDAMPTISGAVIDGVTTVPAGQPAAVNLSLVSGVLHFSFQVPQGQAGQDGAPGQTGAQGPPFANAVVDGVTTLNPSENATVQTSFDGSDVHFTFGIPRGQEGASAAPITSFLVDGVNTLNPGDNATVQAAFDGASVRFTFGIPRGNDGTNGSNGTNGSDGAQGPAGPPFTNFIVDGVTMLNPSDPASVQTNFDGSAVRLLFNLPRGFTGSDGPQGPAGPPFTNFVVDGVNTVNPTDPASVQATFDGSAVRLVFNLPRGFAGSDGSNGTNGSDGAQGPVGPQGPPFANAVVDSVTTLNPGDNATVQTTFDGSNVRFQFGIPRGFTGNDGGTGPQGPPGEVTSAQLSSAISGTSSNSNVVSTLDTPFTNDPPTLADLELMRAKVNELITALRR